MTAWLTVDEAFKSELGPRAREALLKMVDNALVSRRGIGGLVDQLTVEKAREVVQEIDRELTRVERYREALIALKTEIVVSIK